MEFPNVPSVSSLLYVPVSINLPQGQNDPSSEPTEPAKRSIPGLINSVSLLNIIYDHVVKQHHLEPLVAACQTTKVTLADSTLAIYSSHQITLKFNIAGTKHREVFLIASIGTESIILGMSFLECANPDINWKSKTLAPCDVPGPRSPSNPTVTDIPDYFPDSSNSPTLNDKPNTPLKSFMKPSLNQNIKVCLINQLHIDPEDQVYLFHVYSNLINPGGLSNVYHNLNNVFAKTSSDQFVLPPHCGNLDYHIDLEPSSKPVY